MHGTPLSARECVVTMLAYFDRQMRDGLDRISAIIVTGNHFGVHTARVKYFVEQRDVYGEEAVCRPVAYAQRKRAEEDELRTAFFERQAA